MSRTPLRTVGLKRAAEIAAGTWQPKPKPRLKRTGKPKQGGKIKAQGKRGKRLKPAMEAAYAVAIERAGGVCQVPGCRRMPTEIHHLHSRSARPDLREDHRNMANMCEPCHTYWQKRGATFRQMYAKAWPYFADIYNNALDVLKVGEVEG